MTRRKRTKVSTLLLGSLIVLLWGVLHAVLAGQVSGTLKGVEKEVTAALKLERGVEGLFLIFLGVIGIILEKKARTDPTASGVLKISGVTLLILAAWHHLESPLTDWVYVLCTPLYTLAAAFILCPLFLPGRGPAHSRTRSGGRRNRVNKNTPGSG